ncbi:fibronectin type III domain-containing protein [Curtobacterium sp. ER1/6]|uniref:fibronectin type III domain-containing protein n=1 Tax=Curtobacterium sp. ER1/6 TaxID=1891920 RepID=UPI000A9CC98B|nr:fibronectin type III domain-containing protein [Curtobacterium sp. ER1/6]
MQRPTLLAVATAFIAVAVLTTAAPADAAPSQPSPPAHVAVTGQDDSATVTWSAGPPVRRAHVTGYTVSVTPTARHRHHSTETVGPRTFSARFGHLAEATTYTFTVRAKSGRTLSAPVSVRYTRPAAHVESLYAINEAGALVRRPVAGGTWQTITGSGSGYAVDGAGTAYVASADGRTITAYPESGGSKVVATGVSVAGRALLADDAGDLFFTQSWSIIELPHGSATTRTVGPGDVVAVSPNGWLTAQTKSAAVLVYDPSGVWQSIPGGVYNYLVALGVDTSGNVYIRNRSTGGSGYFSVDVAPSGSSSLTSLLEPDGVVALSRTDVLSALRTTTWCAAPSRASGSCTPDTRVSSLWQRTASGSVTTVPISGLDIGSDAEAAADSAGDVFVSPTDGPNTGLVRVPASGGAVEQLDTATYDELSVH